MMGKGTDSNGKDVLHYPKDRSFNAPSLLPQRKNLHWKCPPKCSLPLTSDSEAEVVAGGLADQV